MDLACDAGVKKGLKIQTRYPTVLVQSSSIFQHLPAMGSGASATSPMSISSSQNQRSQRVISLEVDDVLMAKARRLTSDVAATKRSCRVKSLELDAATQTWDEESSNDACDATVSR
eukprot:s1313_g9.t1